MARFETLQNLFDPLWRAREAKSHAALCDALGASPATIKRLIAFLRDQWRLDVPYDRNLNGNRLERGPKDVYAAVLPRVSKGQWQAFGRGESKDRIRLWMSQLRSEPQTDRGERACLLKARDGTPH